MTRLRSCAGGYAVVVLLLLGVACVWAGMGHARPRSARGITVSECVFGGAFACRRALSVVAEGREAARVVVTKTGFSEERLSGGSARRVAYGLVLANRSYEQDALEVRVSVRFLGAGGRRLGSDSVSLVGVPASTTFYLGARARLPGRVAVQRLVARVSVGASRERGLFLPVVTVVRVRSDRLGRLRVSGALTNADMRTLSEAATVYAVVFDAKGRVVGGGAETVSSATGGAVAAGQTVAFTVTGLAPTPAHQAAFAGVSVNP
jgi:hypothetical protein